MLKKENTFVDVLVTQLADEDGRVRQHARIALVNLGEPAVEPLIGALGDVRPTVHWEAIKALSQIGSPRATQVLIWALQEPLTPGPAAALDLPFAVRHVVVGELFAFANRARRADPDDVADDVHVAVALARVIDEASDVAADVRIAHPAAVDLKTPDSAALHIAVLALEALLMRDHLPRVVDNPLVLWNAFCGEHSPTVQFRTTTCDHGLPFEKAHYANLRSFALPASYGWKPAVTCCGPGEAGRSGAIR